MPAVNLEAAKKAVGDSDLQALTKAKRQETRKMKQGWRYYKINDRHQVLIPYDEDGNPTELGQRIIAIQEKLML